jgi:hypothetical protein
MSRGGRPPAEKYINFELFLCAYTCKNLQNAKSVGLPKRYSCIEPYRYGIKKTTLLITVPGWLRLGSGRSAQNFIESLSGR